MGAEVAGAQCPQAGHARGGRAQGTLPAGSWRLWVAPASCRRAMEGLELAARVSQCGRTPPLHEQCRHHSRPGLWGMALRPLPDMLGLAEPGTTGAPSEAQPCRGMGASGRAQSGKGQRGSQCPPLGG